MADFQTSTHRSRWIYTPQDLVEKYKASNQRAVQNLEKFGTTRIEVDSDGSFTFPSSQIDPELNSDKHSRPKAMNCEEEQVMRAFYENKIQQVARAFHFPHKIQGTAITYFKRFYLEWSVMEHHPKDIMLTCVYVACKIEENHVSAEELGKGIKQDHQMILNNEMIVLQSLGFDLIVYTPYRAIEGFILDMEDFCHAAGGQPEMLKDLHKIAVSDADKAMLSDAPLLFSPGQLALSFLRNANDMHRVVDFDRYLQDILSRQKPAHTISELTQAFNTIDTLVKRVKIYDEKDMKHIARKLKSCQDGSSHDEKKRDKKSKHKSRRSSHDKHSASHIPA
ncbi:hypothetical protein V2J09_011354 [Rumex salicifolius]